MKHPKRVLEEMRRVAPRALVTVPNFGHWRVRLQVAVSGRAPVTSSLPYEWYETPNLHFLSMRDFRELARRLRFRIVKELPMAHAVEVSNVFAADELRPSLPREEALKNAPHHDREFYLVPAVLGE